MFNRADYWSRSSNDRLPSRLQHLGLLLKGNAGILADRLASFRHNDMAGTCTAEVDNAVGTLASTLAKFPGRHSAMLPRRPLYGLQAQ